MGAVLIAHHMHRSIGLWPDLHERNYEVPRLCRCYLTSCRRSGPAPRVYFDTFKSPQRCDTLRRVISPHISVCGSRHRCQEPRTHIVHRFLYVNLSSLFSQPQAESGSITAPSYSLRRFRRGPARLLAGTIASYGTVFRGLSRFQDSTASHPANVHISGRAARREVP